MRVYISGPMTGYPAFNYPAFELAALDLVGAGYTPLSPHRHPKQDTWADYMRLDLADVLAAEGVAVLPGWECSRGAVLEVQVAHALGMVVAPVAEWVARGDS